MLYKMVRAFLNELMKASDVLKGIISESEPESEHSDGSQFRGERIIERRDVLQRCYEAIVSVLDSLFHVSIYIRGLDNNIRVTRAARHVESEDGADVLAEFRSLVARKVKWLWRETPEWLVQRVADAVTLRRRQFYYHRAHRGRLSLRARSLTTFVQQTVDSSMRPVNPKKATSDATPHARSSTKIGDRTTIRTVGTAATELEQERILKPEILYTPSEKRIGENIFPDAPAEPHGKDFECTQCFHILPAEFRGPALWRYCPNNTQLT
jgi:hypothetical protein